MPALVPCGCAMSSTGCGACAHAPAAVARRNVVTITRRRFPCEHMVDVSIPRCEAPQIRAHLFDLGVADLGSRERRHLSDPLPDDLVEFRRLFLERHERWSLTASPLGTMTRFADAGVWRLGIADRACTGLRTRRCRRRAQGER